MSHLFHFLSLRFLTDRNFVAIFYSDISSIIRDIFSERTLISPTNIDNWKSFATLKNTEVVAASSLKMETHFTLIPNGVKEMFFDYMDKFFSDSRGGGVASEYLLLNGRISEGLSSMYRYYLKQDMNEQEVRIAYGHRIVLSLCNLCGLIFSADPTVSNIDVDEQSDYDIYWVNSKGVRILVIEPKINTDAIALIVGYYMTPKRTSRAARLSGKEQIPVIGSILSATEWQLVIFPFAKNCINGVVSKKQKLVSEGPIFGMLSPQLWCLLLAYCRSFPHMKTHLSAEDLTAGQTLCRRKTYSSLITTPALEHEKELIQAKKAEEKPRKKQRKLRKQRKRQRKLRKQRKRQRKLRKQRKRQRKLRKQRKRQRKLRR